MALNVAQRVQKTVLVTGASGVIGPMLIQRLLIQGYRVRALDLRPPPPGSLHKDVDIHVGDLADSLALKQAVAGTDIVFHLAAKLHFGNPSPTDREEYKEVNVEGTRRVVEAARAAGVDLLIFFSTINVYGCTERGIVHDENSPIRPDSWYAQSKAEAESIVLAELPAVVLRLAAVYGPGMKGNYPRLLNALRQGHFFMIGDGQNRRTLVYLRDVCQAAVLAGEHPDAVGRIYNVTDGQIHTLRGVVGVICKALGKEPPRFSLPVGLVRPAFGLLEDALHLLSRKPPVGRSTVDKLIEDLAVSGDRIQEELGFRPQYDLLTGWQEIVQQMVNKS